jgi:polyferredoxin
MSKSSHPLSSDQIESLQKNQARREILDKIWSWIIIFILVAVIMYGIAIQLLSHP